MDIEPNFEVVKKAGVSRSEVWKLRWVWDLCFPVKQVKCDMTLKAEVMCLVYVGPQDNWYSIIIYILDDVVDWLL